MPEFRLTQPLQVSDQLEQLLQATPLAPYAEELAVTVAKGQQRVEGHGDYPRWQSALDALPGIAVTDVELNADTIRLGHAGDLDEMTREACQTSLQQLHPWRKGPFELFGVHIDTEWRSDWKWNRLKDAISPLAGRTVLDVGCGSGYHSWRMRGAGADCVVGIDPTPLFAMHFAAIQRYVQDERVQYWPIGIDDLPAGMGCFDTVFSMGILYHRRSPIDHLLQLKELLRPGGELVLETLVIEGDAVTCLVPEERYAKMRNVWFIPSTGLLGTWLRRAGFSDIRLIDEAVTTTGEQRRTDWMRFESLADFLDAGNSDLTIEGYPAPRRAVMIARNG